MDTLIQEKLQKTNKTKSKSKIITENASGELKNSIDLLRAFSFEYLDKGGDEDGSDMEYRVLPLSWAIIILNQALTSVAKAKDEINLQLVVELNAVLEEWEDLITSLQKPLQGKGEGEEKVR